MMGTVHFALGDNSHCYPGGCSVSKLHLDGSVRDVTVEATLAVGDKLMPGFGELMRKVSLQAVPTAILSRQEAVIRGQSLIVNLPGSPKAIRECLIAVFPAIPYCIDLLEGPYIETDEEVITAFRPKK